MEFTARSAWSLLHGLGFGGLYLLACSGALVELWRRYSPKHLVPVAEMDEGFLRCYLFTMTALAWLAVLSGTYIIYPWYRAAAPPGAINLAAFPQALLKSNPSTAAWHSIGMEWKEHIGWITPISITMATAVFIHYGREIRNHPQLRAAVLCFVLISFFSAGVAGFFGAMLARHAAVEGGPTIRLFEGGAR
jgi:uncharacterized membrane protein